MTPPATPTSPLSFDTTHALTDALVEADTYAEARGWGSPPVLLVAHDRPLPSTTTVLLRELCTVSFTVSPGDVAERTGGIADVLRDLIDLLTGQSTGQPADGPERRVTSADPVCAASDTTTTDVGVTGYGITGTGIAGAGITAGELLPAHPGGRMLAVALLYEDIHADDTDIGYIRRVDAVDTDGRVYQLSRLHGEAQPVVLIDDEPDPADTPATQVGLAALLAALTRHANGAGSPATDTHADTDADAAADTDAGPR